MSIEPPSDGPARRDRALLEAPDEPRFVEARALLQSDQFELLGSPGAWTVRNSAPGGRLVVALGRPERALLAEAIGDRSGIEILCPAENANWLADRLDGWTSEGVELFRLESTNRLEPPSDRVRALLETDSLEHLTPELRDEIAEARGGRTVHSAFADGRAASFAHAFWRTEGQFDISIDTAPPFRRRGLGRLAVSALIRAELDRGRRPVWGALASNSASLAMARSLGFERADELVVFRRD